jgi:hypothetical protein
MHCCSCAALLRSSAGLPPPSPAHCTPSHPAPCPLLMKESLRRRDDEIQPPSPPPSPNNGSPPPPPGP